MPIPPLPDAETLCAALAASMRDRVDPARTVLVGIHTGGVWVAQRLHAALGLKTAPGSIDVSFYRDDYGQRGLHANTRASQIPWAPRQHPRLADSLRSRWRGHRHRR